MKGTASGAGRSAGRRDPAANTLLKYGARVYIYPGMSHIKAGIYRTLDKEELPNYANLDSVIMQGLADVDPGNAHVVPYMWGTTSLGFNVAKVAERLGADAATDTWSLVFDPDSAAKLADCGISLLDDPTEAFSAALAAHRGRVSRHFAELIAAPEDEDGERGPPLRVAERKEAGATVVTILCDSHKKYLSTDLCREEPPRGDYLTPEISFLGYDAIPACDCS